MEKKNNNLVIILLIIIILLLGGLCYLALTGVISLNTTDEEKSSGEKETKVSEIKIDTSKEYVYDATYTYDNEYTKFSRGFTGEEDSTKTISYYGIDVEYTTNTQYLSNLKVPYININSEYAKEVNNELLELYNEYAKEFDKCAKESEEDDMPSCSEILTYRTYTYNNILSVVVIKAIQATSKWSLNYNTYNFDLENGNKITYDEMLEKLDYYKEDSLKEIKDLIKNKMDNLNKEYSQEFDLKNACSENGEKANCYNLAYELFEDSIENDTVLYFVDNEGVLNLLIIPYFDFAQNGTTDHYLVKYYKIVE